MTHTPGTEVVSQVRLTPGQDTVAEPAIIDRIGMISGSIATVRTSARAIVNAGTISNTSSNDGPASRSVEHPEAPSGRLSPELGEAIDGQYHGPSSAQSFLGRALHRFSRADPQLPSGLPQNEGTDNAILSFGDRNVVEPDLSIFTWPDYDVATGLLNRYFEFASPTYRFMHEPTMYRWLSEIYAKSSDVPNSVAALVLLMFAAAALLQADRGDSHQLHKSSEVFFAKSQRLLAEEKGPPRLESVQARFATVQYLLSSSRPSKALFNFGTMVQLLQAVGLHRRHRSGANPPDAVAAECQKRMFWCAFTLDKYLSIVMGRPPLLHLDDTNQGLPAAVNDEDLAADRVCTHASGPKRDCLLHATIAHTKLAFILARALQDQHRLPGTADHSHVEAAVTRSQEILVWQSQLTPILSGAIHPSSLIPCFRRQHGVLALGRLHAMMFITRPLLLRDLSRDLPYDHACEYRHHLQLCIQAAKDAVEAIIESARDKQLYPAFWNTQYIAFNAISIIYIYLIQLSRGRIPDDLFPDDPVMESKDLLFDLAHTGQLHLAEATNKNAPVWRYNLILDGLSAQTSKCIASADVQDGGTAQHPADTTTTQQSQSSGGDDMHGSSSGRPHVAAYQLSPSWTGLQDSMFDELIAANMDNSLTMEFWPQFDSLPLNLNTH